MQTPVIMKRGNSMTLQQVLSQVRRAADDYEMIQDGDKIAVGISGGKDSLTLLYGAEHAQTLLSASL